MSELGRAGEGQAFLRRVRDVLRPSGSRTQGIRTHFAWSEVKLVPMRLTSGNSQFFDGRSAIMPSQLIKRVAVGIDP